VILKQTPNTDHWFDTIFRWCVH